MEFFSNLLASLPGAVAQGLIWGLMAIGVYITFKVLDLADLTVDGTMATGGAVCLVLMTHGVNLWVALLCAFLAGVLAGLCTGLLHTRCGIPAILAGILTQLALYSVNLRIMTGKANQPIGVDKYDLLVSQRYVRELALNNPIAVIFTAIFMSMLDIIGLQLTNLTAYNEYITDVIIAAIVYLSAFALVIRMMIAPKKKRSAEPETEGAVTAEKADNADTEKGGDEA